MVETFGTFFYPKSGLSVEVCFRLRKTLLEVVTIATLRLLSFNAVLMYNVLQKSTQE